MKKVGLFQFGYIDGNIKVVCRILNSSGNYYDIKYVSTINNIGEPDLLDYAYSDNIFKKLIYPYLNSHDICIIMTSVPIEENYITRNIGTNIIICTSYQTQEIILLSNKSSEECAVVAILEELISIEFQSISHKQWSELFHKDPRGCLFDFSGIKNQSLAKLNSCKICPDCEAKLYSNNVPEDAIIYAKRILKRIQMPSFLKAFKKSISSPILSFIYGGVIIGVFVNIFSSLVLSTNNLNLNQRILIGILTSFIILFPIIVYIRMWFTFIIKK